MFDTKTSKFASCDKINYRMLEKYVDGLMRIPLYVTGVSIEDIMKNYKWYEIEINNIGRLPLYDTGIKIHIMSGKIQFEINCVKVDQKELENKEE